MTEKDLTEYLKKETNYDRYIELINYLMNKNIDRLLIEKFISEVIINEK